MFLCDLGRQYRLKVLTLYIFGLVLDHISTVERSVGHYLQVFTFTVNANHKILFLVVQTEIKTDSEVGGRYLQSVQSSVHLFETQSDVLFMDQLESGYFSCADVAQGLKDFEEVVALGDNLAVVDTELNDGVFGFADGLEYFHGEDLDVEGLDHGNSDISDAVGVLDCANNI